MLAYITHTSIIDIEQMEYKEFKEYLTAGLEIYKAMNNVK